MKDADFELRLPAGYEEYEGISEAKGWVAAELRLSDGRAYNIYFVTPIRLAQDAEEELINASFYYEENLLIVPSTDRRALGKAITDAIAADILDTLIPQ